MLSYMQFYRMQFHNETIVFQKDKNNPSLCTSTVNIYTPKTWQNETVHKMNNLLLGNNCEFLGLCLIKICITFDLLEIAI